MPTRRLKLDVKSMSYYYDHPNGGKVYVGNAEMMDSERRIKIAAAEDMNMLYGTTLAIHSKMQCEYCCGYGYWPDHDSCPVQPNELTWTFADPCPHCGSHNHVEYGEYILTTDSCDSSDNPPWENTSSIGLHKALEKFKAAINPCVACGGTAINSNGNVCVPCSKRNKVKVDI